MTRRDPVGALLDLDQAVYAANATHISEGEARRWSPVAAAAEALRAERREARVLGSDAAVAVGRFRPDGPLGYRAHTAPDAPLRATRAEAVADESAWLDGPQGVIDFGEATG